MTTLAAQHLPHDSLSLDKLNSGGGGSREGGIIGSTEVTHRYGDSSTPVDLLDLLDLWLIRAQYRVCDGCDKPIPMARLQAVPYVVACIECQRALEAGGKPPQWDKMMNGTSDIVNDVEMDLS